MNRVTVGYQDGTIHPLWLVKTGMRLARLFGARSLWVQDHFMGFISAKVWKPEITAAAKTIHSPDACFDPMQILAITARSHRGIDIGTLVTEPLRRHPMTIAQSFVTLDHISRGHAICGIGNGERENVEPYGLPWNKQVARLEEALTIIRLLWASNGRPVSYDGQFWTLRDAIFNLPLYEGREPRIWIASHAPRMLALTGRFGDGWVPAVRVDGAEYGRRLAAIRAAGAESGRSMDHFVPGQVMLTAIGESRTQILDLAVKSRLGAAMALMLPAEAWKQHGKQHPLGDDHKGFIEIVPPRITDEQLDQAARAVTPELIGEGLFAGSPDEICAQVAPIVEAGARHLIVSNGGAALTGGTPKDIMRLGSLLRKLRRL